MELFQEMLLYRLLQGDVQITFPGLESSFSEEIEMESYKTLKRIKAVIEDDSLSDADCFMKIEEIILIFEELGSNGGFRHDFG